MVTDWVFDSNLRPFLTVLGWVTGYAFDANDWEAVAHGVRESDAEADRCYEYEFAGRTPARLRLGQDPGTSVVHVRVQVPAEVEPQVRVAVSIFQHFHIRDEPA
jgi:hypothetical protein